MYRKPSADHPSITSIVRYPDHPIIHRPMRFGAVGDLHADFESLRRVMRRHPDIPFWLCVGDVGDDQGLYEPPPSPLYWIKGNNEDFDFVSGQRLRPARGAGGRSGEAGPPSASERGWGPASAKNADEYVVRNLHYIPNGELIEIDGLRVAGVGGTFAPTWYDKKASELPAGKKVSGTFSRTRRDDKRRHFVREEVEAVKQMRDLDVLLTHEAPRPFRVGRFDAGKTPVNEMIASAKPRLHLFGHHHRFAESTVSGVRSICLDLVGRSYLIVDRGALTYERPDT